jgi:membrane protein YqaA with SNARE-associated domain
MPRWFLAIFGFFLSWWGAFILSAIDSSLLFFVPFGNDAVVVYLAARNRDLFWLYPLIMTCGSVLGAAGTYWIGKKAGDAGLTRLVSERRLDRLKARVRNAGAGTMALAAVLPPPFPLSPFVLVCGALEVNSVLFFSTFAGMRVVRFGAEAVLARWQGEHVLTVLRSDTVQNVIIGFVVVAVAGTIVSGIVLWRRTRGGRTPRSRRAATARKAR